MLLDGAVLSATSETSLLTPADDSGAALDVAPSLVAGVSSLEVESPRVGDVPSAVVVSSMGAALSSVAAPGDVGSASGVGDVGLTAGAGGLGITACGLDDGGCAFGTGFDAVLDVVSSSVESRDSPSLLEPAASSVVQLASQGVMAKHTTGTQRRIDERFWDNIVSDGFTTWELYSASRRRQPNRSRCGVRPNRRGVP